MIPRKQSLIYKCLTFYFLILIIFSGCEQQVEIQEEVREERYSISDLIQEKSLWEGSQSDFDESFILSENGNIKIKENDLPFSGYIKIRANGTITSMKSYSSGYPDGDFFEWYENGNLKLKSQYKMGERHGYFYIWTKKGVVYSQRYFKMTLKTLAGLIAKVRLSQAEASHPLNWQNGKGQELNFIKKFAGDPNRGGILHIRETEELYTGVITAMDDNGKKEAVLRYKKGKYDGRISKWNEDGNLWYEAEFSHGELVQITLKEGKPFNPNQIIDLSEDQEKLTCYLKNRKIKDIKKTQSSNPYCLILFLKVRTFRPNFFAAFERFPQESKIFFMCIFHIFH